MTTLFDHSWMTFQRASGVGVEDELHALYLKACQRKNQTPEFADDEQVWPWVMAMWPHQPDPNNLWQPGVRLGWGLADPPESIVKARELERANKQIAAGRKAIEGRVL